MKDETKPEYEADEGPLSDEFMAFLRNKASENRPKGKLISEVSLFDFDFDDIKTLRRVYERTC